MLLQLTVAPFEIYRVHLCRKGKRGWDGVTYAILLLPIQASHHTQRRVNNCVRVAAVPKRVRSIEHTRILVLVPVFGVADVPLLSEAVWIRLGAKRVLAASLASTYRQRLGAPGVWHSSVFE